VLVSPAHNPSARVIPGFRIRQDTIAHLGPMEQVWARRLISQGVWRLVPDDEA
jgi:hypothetical protein